MIKFVNAGIFETPRTLSSLDDEEKRAPVMRVRDPSSANAAHSLIGVTPYSESTCLNQAWRIKQLADY